MSREWLIRTQKNQILGPISRDKMRDLVQKNMLSSKDEITSGNGYWFWIKEKDLLDKYLFGEAPQSFNPIERTGEAVSAVPEPSSPQDSEPLEDEENPSRMASTKENIALKNTIGEEDPTLDRLPPPEDLEYPDEPEEATEELDLDMTIEVGTKQLTALQDNAGDEEDKEDDEDDELSTTKKSPRPLMMLLLIVLILAGGLYYYTGILKRPLPTFLNIPFLNMIFPSAKAQELGSLKKKHFLWDSKDLF